MINYTAYCDECGHWFVMAPYLDMQDQVAQHKCSGRRQSRETITERAGEVKDIDLDDLKAMMGAIEVVDSRLELASSSCKALESHLNRIIQKCEGLSKR